MRYRRLAALGGCLLLTLAVYHPCLGFGFVADDRGLLEAARSSGWLAPYREGMNGTWRPLRVTSYQVDAALFGSLAASGHHVSNLLLHAACGFLVCLLALRHPGSWGAALLAAAVFLVHPLQAESVAWISGRKELLSAALGLWALLLLDAANPSPAPGRRVLGTAALLAAVLAREGAAMILPIAAAEGWLLGNAEARRRLPARLGGAALGGLVLGAVYLHLGTRDALRADWGGECLQRLGTMLPLWGRALRLLLLPVGLRSHAEDLVLAVPGWRIAGGVLALTALGWIARRSGPRGRWLILAGILAYLPASNLLFALRVPFAEHYLYLGLAFFSIGLGSLASATLPRLAWLPLALALALTAARLPVWSAELPFWREAHRQNPRTARMELNLAAAYGNAGFHGPCARHLRRALPRLRTEEERARAAFNLELLRLPPE